MAAVRVVNALRIVQRCHRRLALPGRPRRQIVKRSVRGTTAMFSEYACAADEMWHAAAASSIGNARAAPAAHERTAQIAVGVARVHHAAGRQRIKRQRARMIVRCRHEIAVDIEHHVHGVEGIRADRPTRARRHDGAVGVDAAVRRVHRSGPGLRLSGGPQGHVAVRGRHNGGVQRIGLGIRRNAAGVAGNGEVARRAAGNAGAAQRPGGVPRVHRAAGSDGNELQTDVSASGVSTRMRSPPSAMSPSSPTYIVPLRPIARLCGPSSAALVAGPLSPE